MSIVRWTGVGNFVDLFLLVARKSKTVKPCDLREVASQHLPGQRCRGLGDLRSARDPRLKRGLDRVLKACGHQQPGTVGDERDAVFCRKG